MRNVILGLVCLLVWACKSTGKAVGPAQRFADAPSVFTDTLMAKLAANKWLLAQLDTVLVAPAPESKKPYLIFYGNERHAWTGFAGCSKIGGTYRLVGQGTLKLLPQPLKPFCNTLEQRFFSALQYCTGYYATDSLLVLYNGAKPLAQLRPQKHTSYWAGEWEVDFAHIKTTSGQVLYPGRKPRISFRRSSGEATGHTSCNNFRVAFATHDLAIQFQPPMLVTRMACEGPGEMAFLQLLQTVNNFEFVSRDTLSLKKDEVVLLRFIRK